MLAIKELIPNSNRFDVEVIDEINESNEALPLPPKSTREIHVDWTRAGYISSVNIMRWLKWLAQVKESIPDAHFFYHSCNVRVINTINAIKGFLPEKGKVVSFEVPFFCERCSRGESTTLLVKIDKNSNPETPEDLLKGLNVGNCDKSDCELEFDVLPRYFDFIYAADSEKKKKDE